MCVVAFSGKGDSLSGTRLRRFVTNHFRVSGYVSYTCEARGEVAERLKAAVC